MESNNDDRRKKEGFTNDGIAKRYKPIKRPSAETDNSLVNMLDSIVKGLEGSLGKRTYLCGNPDCGTLIIFHTSGARPVVCHRCGAEIDWEGEYITRIKICPKCNNEYDTNANYCQFHLPPVSLIEKVQER
jgi:hypothetical protein